MKKYIRDLTNDLIGRHKFHRWIQQSTGEFIASARQTLESSSLQRMKAETLGTIISSFEAPDIDSVRLEVDTGLYEAGDCKKLLVEIAATLLAQAIFNRLWRWGELELPESLYTPPTPDEEEAAFRKEIEKATKKKRR